MSLFNGEPSAAFRQLVLKIKQQPQSRTSRAVIQLLAKVHPLPKAVLLVPIPSCKKKRGNPLLDLIAEGFGLPSTMLLHRTQAGLSQNHLNRSMRMHYLEGVFHATPALHVERSGLAYLQHSHDWRYRLGCSKSLGQSWTFG